MGVKNCENCGNFKVTKCTVVCEVDECQLLLHDNEGGCR